MLYDFIAKLQRKPERIKRQVLVALTILAAVLLAVGWLATVKGRLGAAQLNSLKTTEISSPAAGQEIESRNLPGPLAALKSGLELVFSDAKDKLGDLLKASETTGSQRAIYQLPDNK